MKLVQRQLPQNGPVQYTQSILAQWVGTSIETSIIPCNQYRPTKTLCYSPTDGVSNSI